MIAQEFTLGSNDKEGCPMENRLRMLMLITANAK